MKPWTAVDLDGTLARHDGTIGDPCRIGPPVPAMVRRVREWLRDGRDVRVFTTRVSLARPQPEREAARSAIEAWSEKHIGQRLEVTSDKAPGLVEMWDDRAVRVQRNHGTPSGQRLYVQALTAGRRMRAG